MSSSPMAASAFAPNVLEGQVALVTGASRGIGAEIAGVLAAHGARVCLGARKVEQLASVESAIREAGGEAFALPLDVTSETSVDDWVGAAADRAGRVDIVVNCAGMLGPAGPFHEQSVADWDRLIATNLRGIFLVCRATTPRLLEQGSGVIVNVSSILGLKGAAMVSPYCTSKFAILGFTQSIALELAPKGIRVNAVCPGYVDTALAREGLEKRMKTRGITYEQASAGRREKSPLKRLTEAREVADTVLYLCTPAASALIGQALTPSVAAELG